MTLNSYVHKHVHSDLPYSVSYAAVDPTICSFVLLENKQAEFQGIGGASLGARAHNGITAVVISPDTPGATAEPQHMFINEHLLLAGGWWGGCVQTVGMALPSGSGFKRRLGRAFIHDDERFFLSVFF